MAEKTLYSVGEIAELTDTSGKTLRYYDSIGLLKPGYKNPETLGFSQKEIQALLEVDAPEQYAREVSKK